MITSCGRAVLGFALAAVTLTTPACSAPTHTGPSAGPLNPTPEDTRPAATSLADAIRQWEAVAGDHFTASGAALQQVSEATAIGDEAAMRTACTQLHDANAVGLQHDLPSPDPMLTAELQRMIDDINTAAHACLRFVDGRAATDASTYQDFLARAVAHLHRAKGILDADLAPK